MDAAVTAVGRLVTRAGQPVLSRVSALVLLLVSGLVLPLATVLGLICFDERIGALLPTPSLPRGPPCRQAPLTRPRADYKWMLGGRWWGGAMDTVVARRGQGMEGDTEREL